MAQGDRSLEGERVDLLRAARSVQRAAVEEDVDALHDLLCELRNDLVAHAEHERRADDPVGDLHGRLTRHGHDRLLRFVDRALTEATDTDGCGCLVLAAELRAMLVRQVRLEAGTRSRCR